MTAVHACIVLSERPPAAVLVALHRMLGVGIADVQRRIAAGTPLVRVELFGNDHTAVAHRLRAVLAAVAPYRHEVHECIGDARPSPGTRIDADTLRAVLADVAPPPALPPRPVPDPVLTRVVADAARAAITDLRRAHPERFHAFALLTTGEALPPYLSACSAEATDRGDRWAFPDSPYAAWGYDEHFRDVVRAFDVRGALHDLATDAAAAEYATRLASIEEALRVLDVEGFFGTGDVRGRVLLVVGTLPPDPADAGFVRRLNPPGALRAEWLRDCAEGPQLPTGPAGSASPDPASGTSAAGGSGIAPNPAVADLWRATPGLHLPDGTAIYGPHTLVERNVTYEVDEYAPGWALVGDDGGGCGYLMRAPGPGFVPAAARAASEVFRLGLGALGPDVAGEGEFVTDDLIGWLACRA